MSGLSRCDDETELIMIWDWCSLVSLLEVDLGLGLGKKVVVLS